MKKSRLFQVITMSIFMVTTVCYASLHYPKAYDVYHGTSGSEFTFNAADIEGIDSFSKKTTFYLTKPTINVKKAKKIKLKLLSYDTDTATYLLKKALDAGIYELWVQQKQRGQKTEPILVSNNFEVRPPSIHELEGDIMVTKQSIVLTGTFFTSKSPKVWVQYKDPKSGKIKKIRAKVAKNKLKYRFEGQLSPMNARTGASQLTFNLSKTPPPNAENIQVHCSTLHGKSIYIYPYNASAAVRKIESTAGQLISATKLNESNFEIIIEAIEQMAKAHSWWEYVTDVIELLYKNRLYSTLDCYQLIYYTTNPLGGLQTVSGVVFIPKNPDTSTTLELPMLSMQHGTQVQRSDSPSLNLLYAEDIFAQLYAWKGYIVPMADYPGLGINHDQQPYANYAVTNSIIDMMKVTKDFIANHYPGTTRWSGKLGLIGYSEGGYLTMATGKVLQENYSTEFPVEACAPLEGPYSLSDTMMSVMRKYEPFKAPYFLPTILNGYDAVYKNETSVFDFNNSIKSSAPGVPSGYNTTMYNLINDISGIPEGESVSQAVNDWMAKAMQDPATFNAPRDVLTPEFSALLDQDTGILYDKLYANDSYRSWIPQTMVMKLFHCEQDDLVPVGNAQVAYQALINQGASSDYLQPSDIYSIQLLLDLFKIIDEKLLKDNSIHVINAPFGFMKGIDWMDTEMMSK